jgi:prevent-host-death family protein
MESVSSFDAATHLPVLLDRVVHGERITITREGVPVAVLVPAIEKRKADAHEAIQAIREFRKGQTLGGLSIRTMIEEGRR